MSNSVHCCLQSLKWSYWHRRLTLTYLKVCRRLYTTSLGQVRQRSIDYSSPNTERPELVLVKHLLSMDHNLTNQQRIPVVTTPIKYGKLNNQLPHMVPICHNGPCSTTREDGIGCLKYMDKEKLNYILISQKFLSNDMKLFYNTTLASKTEDLVVEPRTVCQNYDPVAYNHLLRTPNISKTCMDQDILQYMAEELPQKPEADTKSRGPSSEQLSLVLLRLREELPHFFEGHHRYSIYSENVLFVNRLTRTTTRSLKAYKFVMNIMQYSARAFWYDASLDVLQITKHPEDNTIKVRWSAKGIPWYYLPIYMLNGKPYLFQRYVDGFSIFEIGRDGLIHCHRLDKVIPTATPERQRWSIRAQILTLLGLAEIERGACEAFQNNNILKKV